LIALTYEARRAIAPADAGKTVRILLYKSINMILSCYPVRYTEYYIILVLRKLETIKELKHTDNTDSNV